MRLCLLHTLPGTDNPLIIAPLGGVNRAALSVAGGYRRRLSFRTASKYFNFDALAKVISSVDLNADRTSSHSFFHAAGSSNSR